MAMIRMALKNYDEVDCLEDSAVSLVEFLIVAQFLRPRSKETGLN